MPAPIRQNTGNRSTLTNRNEVKRLDSEPGASNIIGEKSAIIADGSNTSSHMTVAVMYSGIFMTTKRSAAGAALPTPNARVMTKRTTAGTLCAALALLLVPATAAALPGQSTAQFQAWANGNAALTGLKKSKDEMSGLPLFQAHFTAGSINGNFLATLGDGGNVTSESLGYDGAPDNYDILKHADVAVSMIQTVYGRSVAADMKGAVQVGRWTEKDETSPTALYRGSLYGYELAHAFVKLIPTSSVGKEAAMLKTCATQACGD